MTEDAAGDRSEDETHGDGHATPSAEVTEVPTENTKRRATWAGLLLEATEEVRAELPIDETGYLRVAGPSHADARAFVLYAVLDQALAASAAVLRWIDLFKDMEQPGAEVDRFWLDSIVADQSSWTRRLVEALIDLICFQTTNEDAYYRHLLLLTDLQAASSTDGDLRTFFACPSANVGSQITRLATQTAELEESGAISLARSWYTSANAPRTAEALTAIQAGRHLTSRRTRLRTALPLATASEKLAVGLTYDRLYSQVSQNIHFNPGSRTVPSVVSASAGVDQVGILGLNVVLAAHRLLGQAPGAHVRRLEVLLTNNEGQAEILHQETIGSAEPGDFVLAHSDLAEILDVVESDFGYRSYRVLFLSRPPIPEIADDWVPAESVRVLFSRGQAASAVEAAVSEGKVPERIRDLLLSADGAEAWRASMKETWEAGLRDHILQPRHQR